MDFFVGNSFFRLNWVTSPSSTKARDGLGPLFNARSCAACHMKDGRGMPSLLAGGSEGLLFRLSIGGDKNGAPLGHPKLGNQLNEFAILGTQSEGKIDIQYEEIQGTFEDGETYSLRKPIYILSDSLKDIPELKISPRVGPQMIGMGLLAAIPEETLLLNADPEDKNNDGISGKVNYVWDKVKKKISPGRFGWKANQPGIRQQTADALVGDIGITSSINSDDGSGNNSDPEIDPGNFEKLVLYVSNLAVPARRKFKDKDVLAGEKIFEELKCSACHIPSFKTGNHPDFKNLSNQNIQPFSDLLLHDMGKGLADNRPDFLADGKEWRTQPLWGIGLIETVNGHTLFLHDGRARNLTEAILWHGGEAEKSRDNFKKLPKIKRNQLIEFIKSL